MMALATLESAGSCAITAVLDAANGKLYVANFGDSRAVAGWYDPSANSWRCDVLSDDLCGNNPREVDR